MLVQRESDECLGCGGHGYWVVAGVKKECPECGPAAQMALEIEAAEALFESAEVES